MILSQSSYVYHVTNHITNHIIIRFITLQFIKKSNYNIKDFENNIIDYIIN